MNSTKLVDRPKCATRSSIRHLSRLKLLLQLALRSDSILSYLFAMTILILQREERTPTHHATSIYSPR